MLSNLVKMNPEDADLADEFARNQLQQASELVSDGFYAEALPYLKGAVRGGYDDETKLALWTRLMLVITNCGATTMHWRFSIPFTKSILITEILREES